MKKIAIKTETINLDQFLKWAGIFTTGGEAKLAIKEGKVKVNGKIETRRSRKLKQNDVVEFENWVFMVTRG